MDQRFADVDPEDEQQQEDHQDLEAAEETDRQMAILSSLVAMAPASAK